MTFTESNTVKQMVLDATSGLPGTQNHTAQLDLALHKMKSSGAPIRLNPEIAMHQFQRGKALA